MTKMTTRRRMLTFLCLSVFASLCLPEMQAATTPKQKRLLVVGATGGTGREVVAQARTQGYAVRALVRDEAKARAQLGDEIEYVEGDVRTGVGLSVAVAGVDYVISALGSNVRNDPQNTPELVDYGGVKALAEAAAAAGVRQFVLVSSMGVTHRDHPLNKMFANILVWKAKGEDALRDSAVPYTIVRPGGLANSPGGVTGVRAFQGDDLRNAGRIPRADVAAVCLAALGNAAALNKTFEILSDESTARTDFDALFAGLKADAR